MKPVSTKSGVLISPPHRYPIAAATEIYRNQLCKLSGNKVVAAAVAETTAMLGVPAEDHSGSADMLNSRANGTVISVYDSDDNIYESEAPKITATSGNGTTVVVSGLAAVFANDDFNGGFLKLIEKATASTLTDAVGTVYEITDYTGSSGTFTGVFAGNVSAGDKFQVFPPDGFQKGNLDAALENLVLTASATLPIRVRGCDIARGKLYHEAALHAHANSVS